MMTITQFRAAMRDVGRNGEWAWPGGYPRYFVMTDGDPLSVESARDCRREILSALARRDTRSGWAIAGMDINWENDHLRCCHSGKEIPSAYGGD